MKQTKKEILRDIEIIRKDRDTLSWENSTIRGKLDALKRDIENLEREKQRVIDGINERAEKLRKILDVLCGEAKSLSKYEVIRDMFLEEIKQEQAIKENRRNYPGPIRNNLTMSYMGDRI